MKIYAHKISRVSKILQTMETIRENKTPFSRKILALLENGQK
jgi:hypothetical protein